MGFDASITLYEIKSPTNPYEQKELYFINLRKKYEIIYRIGMLDSLYPRGEKIKIISPPVQEYKTTGVILSVTDIHELYSECEQIIELYDKWDLTVEWEGMEDIKWFKNELEKLQMKHTDAQRKNLMIVYTDDSMI